MKDNLLKIRDLSVSIGNKRVVSNFDLKLGAGEVHFLMGPNGCGKSSFANFVARKPGYEHLGGEIIYKGENLIALEAFERAKKGIFVAYQNPPEVTGVRFLRFLEAINADLNEFRDNAIRLGFNYEDIVKRSVNVDFSGGEKKKSEILQLVCLKPQLAILDEIDSGLDVDAIKAIAEILKDLNEKLKMSILAITHHGRLSQELSPDYVHIMARGSLVKTGGPGLITELEETGYEAYLN